MNVLTAPAAPARPHAPDSAVLKEIRGLSGRNEEDLMRIYRLVRDFIGRMNRLFAGWNKRLLKSDKVDASQPIQSFYNLVTTRMGKPIDAMSTSTAEFLQGLFCAVETEEDRLAFACILAHLVGIGIVAPLEQRK